jgi:UDP:flavonoid glycosyltransferase YjiC (YdhE family)
MAVILFDMFPAQGHINGSLRLSRPLHNKGHDIVYASEGGFRLSLQQHGFNFYDFNQFVFGKSPNLEVKEKGVVRFFFENINRAFTKQKIKQFESEIGNYDIMMSKLRPDLIILDEHYAAKAIIYSKYDIPILTLQTSLIPDYDPLVPPFNKRHIPHNTPMSKLSIQLLWLAFITRLKIVNFTYKIICLGKVPAYYHQYFANEFNFPYFNKKMWKRLLGIRFRHIPSIVIPPKSFDFPREVTTNVHYLGIKSNPGNQTHIITGRLQKVIDVVSAERKYQPEIKLIYCSLGTITYQYLDVCIDFFNRLFKVCERNRDLRVIISVGSHLNISELPISPGNVFIFEQVPQIQLLDLCDFVITHGGLNTVLESVLAEKPMIVFPLSMSWDQNGNSARVVFHGLGVRGNIRKVSAHRIERLINELIKNFNTYKRNLQFLRDKLEDNSADIISMIESTIKTSSHAEQSKTSKAIC